MAFGMVNLSPPQHHHQQQQQQQHQHQQGAFIHPSIHPQWFNGDAKCPRLLLLLSTERKKRNLLDRIDSCHSLATDLAKPTSQNHPLLGHQPANLHLHLHHRSP